MFKKKPAIKALAPLRSSDRRKIADKIIKEFEVDLPNVPEKSEPEEKAEVTDSPSKLPTLASVRNSLLPENTQSARFTTTAGPDLKVVSGTVYVGGPSWEEQRILWVKIDERIYPTVYTLWHNPRLVPLLHTPDMVLQKLRGGADLMTPGLAGPPFPRGAAKGAIVAVASLQKPTVPMVVGVCEIDVSALKSARGEKGRAVRGVHWEGDELWSWTLSGQSGAAAPDHIDAWNSDEVKQIAGLEDDLDALDIEGSDRDAEGGVSLPGTDLDVVGKAPHNEYVEGEDAGAGEKAVVEEKALSTKEIDEAFRNAFLYGVHHHVTSNRSSPNHGLVFPLTSSFVMSDLILPYLPAFTPAQTASLQIKKTTWKNLKKFIKTLEKDQLLKSKDRNGGETVVLDIDFKDHSITQFKPYPLPKKDSVDGLGDDAAKSAGTSSTGDSAVGQRLRRLVFYMPKESLKPLFEASKASVKDTYSASELRPIIVAYLEAESLILPANKRLVKLNPVLANSVFDSGSILDREVLAKGSVPRDVLIDRVLKSCSPSWAILRGEETKDDVRTKAGSPPSINILLETRSGNKVVTKVSGVEAYHIYPQPLADELQKACASSTSVGQLVGSSPKNPVMEIMVQGPQLQAVTKALEKRGVSSQWVSVVDKTKGKKR